MVSKLEKDAIDAAARKQLNDLLSNIDLTSIVSLDTKKGLVYIGGQLADAGKLSNLKSEAQFLMESYLWKVLNHTIRELAQRSLFVSGETMDDIKKGRSILYVLDNQQKIIDVFKSYQQR